MTDLGHPWLVLWEPIPAWLQLSFSSTLDWPDPSSLVRASFHVGAHHFYPLSAGNRFRSIFRSRRAVPDRGVGSRGGVRFFFLPPSLMQKLNHDPSSQCKARDSGWTGRLNGAAQRLMRPYLTADRQVREKINTTSKQKKGGRLQPPSHSRLQTTHAKHETHNCVQTRSGMRTAARVRRVCSR